MYSRIIAALSLFFVSSGLVTALPSPDHALRQVASVTVPTALTSPTSFTTTNTVQTANGPMTETCVVTLTPVGQQIQEIQNCTVSVGGSTASPKAAGAFVMPGTSIQVLPVGLGVFGGITAVAVFVVAFVTWERVQHRKTFREQRMAETRSISEVGYGGVTKGDLTN